MSERDGIRLFMAVEIPPAVRRQLAAWARAAARAGALRRGGGALRVLDADLLHVTVWFLGERSPWEIEPLGQILQGTGTEVGELALGAPVWLPPRRPRALAVELHEHQGGLSALRDELTIAIGERLEGVPQARRLRPHVTVARMPSRSAPARHELPPTPGLSFSPEALVLYRSRLSPRGASYEALARRRLGG